MNADATAATNGTDPLPPDGQEAEKPQGAESAPAASDPSETPKPKESDGFTKRIDELTGSYRSEERARIAAERDRDHWRELAMRAKPEPVRSEPEPPQAPARKTLADFAYDEGKYTDYLFSEAEKRAEAVAERKVKETYQRTSFQDRATDFQNRAREFAKAQKIDDFEIAFAPPSEGGPHVTADMAEVIMEAENGVEILNHLAKNRDLSRQISRLPPLQQARELGRLEARLANKPVAPKVSAAPPPAPKVEGSASSTPIAPDSPDSDKLSAEEWAKRRNKQLARR